MFLNVKFLKAKLSEDQFRQIGMDIADFLVVSKLVKTKSEARRAIEQKSIKLNDRVIEDRFARVALDGDLVIVFENE